MTLPSISALAPTAMDLVGLSAVLAVLAGTTLLGAAASLSGASNRAGPGGENQEQKDRRHDETGAIFRHR